MVVMMVMLVMEVMVIRKGQTSQIRQRDRQIWHLNLTFQVTCVWQLSQFLQNLTKL